jgi:CRISPR/Cas system CMR-associated protein Cmr5 small subunit
MRGGGYRTYARRMVSFIPRNGQGIAVKFVLAKINLIKNKNERGEHCYENDYGYRK